MPDKQDMLPFAFDAQNPRAAQLAHWTNLTRNVLPAMAQSQGRPISLDHCLMRVCLDMALGAPWHLHVKRPAIWHMSDEQLAAAITLAEGLVPVPSTLDALNSQSMNWRRQMRGHGQMRDRGLA